MGKIDTPTFEQFLIDDWFKRNSEISPCPKDGLTSRITDTGFEIRALNGEQVSTVSNEMASKMARSAALDYCRKRFGEIRAEEREYLQAYRRGVEIFREIEAVAIKYGISDLEIGTGQFPGDHE